ncbi:HAMP domain-containing sensor histidine kinase [Breznakiella homolactica]|uniref:histidine kinase n=1 Tax=Breznakiella homolactica TaxID=2798577 RepID=A0A7T7XLQ1_9SPIR|nr:HAMP domain-containing sensor histidine kinase [Breznakiella homolactica]QQO08518.1 HAMP domain-containing histidine kinase [Breznakiella homolactica]
MKWKQKKDKDPRVTVKDFSFKEWGLIFLVLVVINGNHMFVYQTLSNMEGISVQFLINALIIYLVVNALFLCFFIWFVRYRYQTKPVKKLSEAARNIAAGDFSVRLEIPARKDGRKDYIGVMFEDFNTMADELSSTETLKNDFIANVSHEIKTPLAIIQNYAAALQSDDLSSEERHEFTGTIQEAARKLSALVTNILRLNKLENQDILPAPVIYNLAEQIRCCALAFEDLWEEKGIFFDADLEEITVQYDESMMELVWNNLLSNAVKFTPLNGTIGLSLKMEDGLAVFRIADSGCGMDEITRRRIFDKFYQGDSSHSQEGNGLGLALAKKVLDLVGGTIRVDSEPGKGSLFTVCLGNISGNSAV